MICSTPVSYTHLVKAYVFFKGRSILFKEQGEVLLLRFANDLEDYAKVEDVYKRQGYHLQSQFRTGFEGDSGI